MLTDSETKSAGHESGNDSTAIRMIPFIVGCALFMQMLDSTVVATALPVMADSLHTTAVEMNVTITSYLLALAVFVPISSWAADRFGSRRIFIAAITLFAVSSIGCASSQNLTELVIARIFQGAAGAMMVPVGRIILLRITPKDQLLKAMSFISMPALLGPIIGPPLGGFLVTYASWHWIFLINVPVGALGIALVLRYIENDVPETKPRLDWPGFILSGIALAALVSGFEAIGRTDISRTTTALLIGTGLGCGLLYVWHARRAEDPIIDLSLLRTQSFAVSILGGNLCRFSVGAMPFMLALLLQVGFGMTPFATGLITFTSAVGAFGMKLMVTHVIGRLGFRPVLVYNAIVTGVFVIVCGFFHEDTPVWMIIAVLFVGGTFRSLQFTAINTLTYADLTPADMSRASSFAAMAQQLGISLGVGCAALIMNLSTNWRGAAHLERVDVMWAFFIIGLLAVASAASFARLPANTAEHTNTRRRR